MFHHWREFYGYHNLLSEYSECFYNCGLRSGHAHTVHNSIQAKKEWKSVEDKQRYLRLQLLLDKSEIYCKFLQERMEKQRLDAQKHQERMAKKEEKRKRQDANSTQQVF